jgi:hypothetical protein
MNKLKYECIEMKRARDASSSRFVDLEARVGDSEEDEDEDEDEEQGTFA